MNISAQKSSAKLGRNDPCPCGSGKKHKACCLNRLNFTPSQNPLSAAEALKYAWQAVAQHDVPATLHWFRAALHLQPENTEALAGLGQALCWQQQRREGLGYLQQAAQQLKLNAQQNRNVRFILELAEQLHHWGDLETALGLTELAVTIEPNSALALNSRALYLTRVNRFTEALPFAQQVRAMLPNEPACKNMLAIIQAQLKYLPEARQGFEEVIRENRNIQQTARAWQELVSVLDRLGDYPGAFEACVQAKKLYLQLPEVRQFDKQQIFSAITYNKAGFNYALLHRWSKVDFADTLPVPTFLLGFLRSGTTLTEQVLAAHPAVFTSDENDLIHGLQQELQRMTSCGDDIPLGLQQLTLDAVCKLRQYYWRRVQEEYSEPALTQCFVDKVALNSINIGLISFIFPEARILFALRDPRDVCLSCFQQAFKPANVSVNLLTWEGVAKQYAAVMDLWLHLKPMLQAHYMELRYEDTVNNFEQSFNNVFALLDLPWSEEIHHFHEKAKGRYIATPSFAAVTQPVYKGALARWRHYEPFLTPILPVLAPYITAFGYHDA